MSDSFEMLVDADVTVAESADLSREVLNQLRKQSLITGRANIGCVLGGKGYRPGPAIAQAYRLEKREYGFWELTICGVEANIGRAFNVWALGESCEGFRCSSCGQGIEPFDEAFNEAMGKAIGEWEDQLGKALLACPHCGKPRSITDWECKPPLGFGNLAFTFWNWPPLDSPAWQIDIAAIVQRATGHRIIRTYGHL